MNEELAVEVLKVDETGRVQTPRARREEIVAAYEATGMTGRQFAAYCGVKYSTLMCWVKRYREKRPDGKRGAVAVLGKSWVEAVVEEGPAAEDVPLEVEVGPGVRLRVRQGQSGLAAELIRALGVVRPC